MTETAVAYLRGGRVYWGEKGMDETLTRAPRRNRVFALALVLALMAASGLFGWRVMPRIWPTIKRVILPESVPTASVSSEPTQEPFTPVSNATLQDVFDANDSVIYYFYKEDCPYCRLLEAFFDGIPERIALADGTVSEIRLIAVDKNSDAGAAICEAYYAAYEIEEERRRVPAVAIGGEYLKGTGEIWRRLYSALLSGKGLDTPLLGDNARE